MESRSHALAAGIFVILLTLAVVGGIAWLGGSREATAEYLVVTAQNVTGLGPQAGVRYRGIRVGKVKDIRLDKADTRNILILIEIDAAVPVTRGTTAKLNYQGVTGIAHVLLEDKGKDPAPLVPGAKGELPRIALAPSILDELGESTSGAMKEARSLIAQANDLLGPENRAQFHTVLANLAASTDKLNRILGDPRVKNVGEAVSRVSMAAEKADRFFHDSRRLLPQLQALTEKAGNLVDSDGPAEDAQDAVARISDLARDLSATTRQLDRVLRTLEEAPESVVFGRPMPPPGPGEAGFVFPDRSQP